MAEVLAVVASGMSVGSMVIQVVDSLDKAIKFCKSIKNAPTTVRRILEELEMLSQIISSMRHRESEHFQSGTSEATASFLGLIRRDITKLSDLVSDLGGKLSSNKRSTRALGYVKTALSEKEIALLRSHVDSAKGGLDLALLFQLSSDIQVLKSQSCQKPKELGYFWERGQTKDHVSVDDGLGQVFFLPLDLCSTPEGFMSILSHKFDSRKLPGLSQIQQGHFGALNWDENTHINVDNWASMVKGGKGIKVAFIMGTWHGFRRNKCIRCFKPRAKNATGRKLQSCSSCGLELRWVEPDVIPFEPADVTIGDSADSYRNYQLKSRMKIPKAWETRSTSEQEAPHKSKDGIDHDRPPIDLVCRRLIIKWEPIFNITHRYLYCRCVTRLSTPSHLEDEMTFLVLAPCPRHNKRGICYQDYGNIDYLQDQYFDRFGGYRSFQALIYVFSLELYASLGGERFLPNEQVEAAFEALDSFSQGNEELQRTVFNEFIFEINDELDRSGIQLPDSITEAVRDERLRRKKPDKFFGDVDEKFRPDLSNSPMTIEVREILAGKWLGKPHWAIED